MKSIGVSVSEAKFDTSKIRNKDVLQSYVLTTARYDFNVFEKRVLYKLVEYAQCEVLGLKFPKDCRRIEHDLFGLKEITMDVAPLLKGEDDKNHSQIKKALLSLQKKTIVYEDNNIWASFSIIINPILHKGSQSVTLRIDPVIWDCILNFSKGYRKFELKTTMGFRSVYAMRFYEILSGQNKPLCFSIEELREMFQITKKYKQINDFIRFVIGPAKRELDEHSPYSFEYKINKQGRKYHSITFNPVQIPANRDPELEQHNLEKQLSPSWILESHTLKYLKDEYKFTPKEINQWYELFKDAQKKLDLISFIAEKKRYAME
ncbi:MAG: replication initiation protein, partial [Bacteroidota bacterium]|nr:replication initiation protein [Bacteroidota bacterium]